MLKKVCSQCGKKGLSLKLNTSGICSRCEELNRKAAIDAAKGFIADFVKHIDAATSQPVIYPGLGREKIESQRNECRYVLDHIDDWKTVPFFEDAFIETLISDGVHRWYTSPLFRQSIVFLNSQGRCDDLPKLFESLRKTVYDLEVKCWINEGNAYDYSKIFQVVGVTFKNGPKHRQAILRRIRFRDPPFQRTPDFTLELYCFEGAPAVGVYANKEQVGNISKDDLPWLLEHWNDYVRISEYDITGGGPGLNYGLMICAVFNHSKI